MFGSSNSACDGAKMAKLTDAAACDMSTKLDSAKCLQMLDNAVAAACITSEALTTVDAFGVDNFFGQSVAQGERCWGCPAECPIPFDEKPAGTAYTCCTLQYKRYVNEINYEMFPPLLEFYTRGTLFYNSTLPSSGCLFFFPPLK